MSDPYIGQISVFAFNFAPPGWALCDGQTLLVGQNQNLFGVIGTTYGGDGINTFRLPEFRGRLPMQADATNPIGRLGGADGVQLTPSEMGPHGHSVRGSSGQAGAGAAGKVLGTGSSMGRGSVIPYKEPPGAGNLQLLDNATIGASGLGAAHDNMQPTLILNFCIALQGTVPPQS